MTWCFMSSTRAPIVTIPELEAFTEAEFPQIHQDGRVFSFVDLGPGFITMRLDTNERHLRPGGTVSGPTLFTFADVSAYFVILAHIGLKAMSVTTSFHMNFLRKAAPGPLFCTCRLLKTGKRLVVVEVSISDHEGSVIAHGSCTYSIPPQ
jgi:uncharacterized protein (TIGR00369 family)